MIYLQNDCYCSELRVNPKNWKTLKKLTNKDWEIYYRFYDPSAKEKGLYSKGKLVRVRGMNHFKNLSDRRSATVKILEDEVRKLQQGYNPILGDKPTQVNITTVDTNTPFIKALDYVRSSLSVAASTERDLRSIMSFVSSAAVQLKYDKISIGAITRRNIKLLLVQIEKNRGGESHHRYNKVRSYLMILFKELVELEAIDTNPIREVSKKNGVKMLRNVLSIEERIEIDKFLREHDTPFWIFTNIFFHSGSRLTEMMKVRLEDVNIVKQTFKVTVIKGRSKKEVLKPIKNVALPFWKEALKDAIPGQYIFSEGLIPGVKEIRTDQITKRWYRHIKKKLKIKGDFYSLKHSNLDETAAMLSLEDASAMASHTSVNVTREFYAVGEQERQHERLKKLDNKFA